MAQGKKSFVFYSNWESTFDKLSDEEAGKLIKHMLHYVNDRDPVPPERLIEIVFEPLKAVLKDDLKKWDEILEKRKESGRLGGKKSGETRSKIDQKDLNEANEANASKTKQNEANEAEGVNVNVNVNVNKKELVKKQEELQKKLVAAIAAASQRKKDFYNSLVPYVGTHPKEMVKAFYTYWSELNKSQTKMKWELEKTWETGLRLHTWANREKIKPQASEFKKPAIQICER